MIGLYILSAVPLALFIILLLVMDSFSLTRWSTLLQSIGSGMVMYVAAWGLCRIPAIGGSHLMVAFVEEFCKGIILYVLIARHKVGLLSDATIYGSAIGAGFGWANSIFYLYGHGGASFWHTIFLGSEAAVMHIGCTSLLAMTLIMVHQGKYGDSRLKKVLGTVFSFIAAVLVHWVHEMWPFNPLILVVALVVYFVVSKHSLFKKNNKFVHEWLDEAINNEVSLLGAVKRGAFASTKAGEYMLSLKESFAPETFFDMLCYVQTYLELSIAARSNMILKEAGMDPVRDPVNSQRLEELNALRKSIGPTAEHAIRPIVDRSQVNNWALDNLI